MAKLPQDQEFVDFVVRGLVNEPDQVETSRAVDEMGVLITIKVAPEDMGILIGKSGQTARSLRTLARVVGAKNNARVNLRIEEPEGGRPPKKEDTAESDAAADAKADEAPADKTDAPAEDKGSSDIDDAVKDLE